ncbi:hypothetical protein Nepgr_029729 [Nepenthes gracilis]|uniref:Uncharacterized protein n=1 Tax=Nepenthes gracilis TaxID=150966 RepID=A0AAD3Y5T8_NEPGR|nr:hypothetical protein Nepgr_029729 [Nepenthes gracilis]
MAPFDSGPPKLDDPNAMFDPMELQPVHNIVENVAMARRPLMGSGLISKDVDSAAVGSDRLPSFLSSDVGCVAGVSLAVGSSSSILPSPDVLQLVCWRLLTAGVVHLAYRWASTVVCSSVSHCGGLLHVLMLDVMADE